MFSESECFILGALGAADSDRETPFYSHFTKIFGMLGLLSFSSDKREDIVLESVPNDVRWGQMTDPPSFVDPSNARTLIEDTRNHWDHAQRWLTDLPDRTNAEAIKTPLAHLGAACEFIGYAPSTPTILYGLNKRGDLKVLQRAAPLPHGLLRLLVETIGPTTRLPMNFLMAAPHLLGQATEDITAEVVPCPDIGNYLVGEDDPEARTNKLEALARPHVTSPAYVLGYSLYSLYIRCCHWSNETTFVADDATDDETDDAGDTGEEASEPHEEHEADQAPHHDGDDGTESSPSMPVLIRELFDFVNAYRKPDEPPPEDDRSDDLEAVYQQMTNTTQDLEPLRAALAPLQMPAVGELVKTIEANVSRAADKLRFWKKLRLFEGCTTNCDDFARDIQRLPSRVDNVLCIAYGDLLLRERYDPAPLPRPPAKAAILRQPQNIRSVLLTAIARLRRDSELAESFAVEMTLLCSVLERLVRDAAAIYLRNTRSVRVADLCHDLLQQRHGLPTPEREEAEAIGRIAAALHHSFRNPVVHSLESIAGGWEEAMFVAFGLLSILNILEKADTRMRAS